MSMLWVGIGSAVLGAGASIYGANKQAGAIQDANQQNTALQQQQNNSAWVNWLMSRGVAPTSPVPAGVMPAPGGYTAVNTRLPIWATMPKSRTTMVASSNLPAVQRWKKR